MHKLDACPRSTHHRPRRHMAPALAATFALAHFATAAADTAVDIQVMFAKAAADGRSGTARKTRPVDARSAKAGEVIVTIIKGEGKETESKPAQPGDMVVRNRCAATGNEEILVSAAKFAERYEAVTEGATDGGWRPYRPRGNEMRYIVVADSDGSFTFTAPWGEAMIAKPGDAIVQDPANAKDTYRIARAAFDCTYEIVTPAAK